MKQLMFMVALTLAGTIGPFVLDPFIGVAVYYLFAVLRPQFMWEWALPSGVRWSLFVAVGTILAAFFTASPSSGRRVALVRAHWWVLAFGFWVAVSYLTATDRAAGERVFIDYVKIFVMFLVASRVIRETRSVWVLLHVAALSLCYIGFEVNSKYFFEGRLDIYHIGYGGLDNNGAGLMLAMGIPLCVALWEATSTWRRWVFAAFVPVILHAVLMTYSRGAMLSLLVASPLLWFRSRQRWHATVAAVAIALIVPLLAGNEIQNRFFSISENERDSSAQSRYQSWRAGYGIAASHPVFGVGPGNAKLHTYWHGADFQGRAIHNTYLEVAADHGFVGLFLYVGMLLTGWASVRRAMRRCATDESEAGRQSYAVASGVEGSMAVFCIGATFLSIQVVELPYILLLLGAQLEAFGRRGEAAEGGAKSVVDLPGRIGAESSSTKGAINADGDEAGASEPAEVVPAESRSMVQPRPGSSPGEGNDVE